MNTILLGCVADDFTGASDAASFLLAAGLKTILVNGTPSENLEHDCDAIVIALKSRTQQKEDAINDSIEAFEWLKKNNAQHLYFKYCSTFDSTKEGNIGPVLDKALEKYNVQYSILCPALPVNKRTVKNGILYVDGVPLSESHMKDHPLTPMWASEIKTLMQEQGKYETLNLDYTTLEKGFDEIKEIIDNFSKNKEHFYIVPDYIEERHATKTAKLFKSNYILSGGSGILTALGEQLKEESAGQQAKLPKTATTGKGIVFAGSCSKMTKAQVAYYKAENNVTYEVDPVKLLNNEITEDEIFDFIKHNSDKEVLIYSSGSGGANLQHDNEAHQASAEALEKTMAKLAVRAVSEDYTRIIVAGGETSSAITKELGFSAFIIGESIEPGVPVMIPTEKENIRLVLKSGNFGQPDFFVKALKMTKE